MRARGGRQVLDTPRTVGEQIGESELRRDVDDLCTGVASDYLQQCVGGRGGVLGHLVPLHRAALNRENIATFLGSVV